MNRVAVAMAKLAGLLKNAQSRIDEPLAEIYDPATVLHLFEIFEGEAQVLREELPELFADLPVRGIPEPTSGSDFEGRGYIRLRQLDQMVKDIEYIFEVRANSELAVPRDRETGEKHVFLSHGKAQDWREVQAHIEKDLGVNTLELAQQPNKGRTVLQKLAEEADRCSYAVIVMTGDDTTTDGEVRARENVMHEIGYFQGRFGLYNVCVSAP